MSSSMPSLPTDFKQKSFWERPEGPAGRILLALMIGAAGWGLYLLLPFLITLLSNLLMASLLAVGLAVLWMVIYNFRNLVWYMFRSLARSVAKWFVEVDPIGIMKSYVEDLRKLHEEMDKAIRDLGAKKKRLDMDIAANKEATNKALSLASAAKKQGIQTQLVLQGRKAGRLSKSTMTLEALSKKLEMIQRVLYKMREVCGFLVEDTADEIKVREHEYESMKAAESAVGAAMKIVRGQTSSRELFDMATETVADRVAQGYAEIEHFTDLSKSFIDSVDLQNGAFEEDALNMLEDWEQKADSIILGDNKARILADVESGNDAIDLSIPSERAPQAVGQRMRDLIKGMPSEK